MMVLLGQTAESACGRADYIHAGLSPRAERVIRTAFLREISYTELAELEGVSIDSMKMLVRGGLALMLSSLIDRERSSSVLAESPS